MQSKANYEWVRITSTAVLLVIATFFFIFALLSGSENYGGGWYGILLNSPNALPWLLMFGTIWTAWKWPKVGGVLLVVLGIAFLFFFRGYQEPALLLMIAFPLWILGGSYIFYSYNNRRNT